MNIRAMPYVQYKFNTSLCMHDIGHTCSTKHFVYQRTILSVISTMSYYKVFGNGRSITTMSHYNVFGNGRQITDQQILFIGEIFLWILKLLFVRGKNSWLSLDQSQYYADFNINFQWVNFRGQLLDHKNNENFAPQKIPAIRYQHSKCVALCTHSMQHTRYSILSSILQVLCAWGYIPNNNYSQQWHYHFQT